MSNVDIHRSVTVAEFMTVCRGQRFKELGKAGEGYELTKRRDNWDN